MCTRFEFFLKCTQLESSLICFQFLLFLFINFSVNFSLRDWDQFFYWVISFFYIFAFKNYVSPFTSHNNLGVLLDVIELEESWLVTLGIVLFAANQIKLGQAEGRIVEGEGDGCLARV